MTLELHDRPVLVTGAAGFIGSHLTEELVRRGARVTIVDCLRTGQRRNLSKVASEIEWHEADLSNDDMAPLVGRGFDFIFHIAGNAYVPASVQDPRRDLTDNVLATFNLLEAVRAVRSTARLVQTSTAAVYGEGVRMPMHEDDATFPVAPYGISKLAAERYAAVYAKVYGIKAAAVRLFSVYGPRHRKQVVYDLMGKIRRNPEELHLFGDGQQVRDFNHISNVIDALLVVAERARFDGDVYNVAGDESVTIEQLAHLMCDRMGASPRFVFSGEVRAGDAQRWWADISRLKALGYRPRVSLAEGITDTVNWYLGECAAEVAIA
jgi:UDP-glucose 4-epimerase